MHLIDKVSIRSKLFIPIGLILIFVVTGVAYFVVTQQNQDLEKAFRNELESLAYSSRLMIHSAAVSYVESKGYSLHQVPVWTIFDGSDSSRFEQEALRYFALNSKSDIYETEGVHYGKQTLFVYTPARLQTECTMCHNPQAIDNLRQYKPGDLVATFGVSGSMEELQSRKSQMIIGSIILGVAILILLNAVIQLMISKMMVAPINEITMQSAQIAEGNLKRIETPSLEKKMHSKDEIGCLARSYQLMVDGLRQIIYQVVDASSDVAKASSEILSNTEQLAVGSQEQSTQATEVASAIEQMTKTISENSKTASSTSEMAKQSKLAAQEGGSVVEKTIQGMKQIEVAVNKSADTVRALSKSSNQIGEIISVIDDIADQTNLLALNAAIEAARAGEQGRGFAVVADEVRKLAERTTGATKEIADMIKQIQFETTEAVQTIEDGINEMKKGIMLASQAGDALDDIVDKSDKLTDMIALIAAASEEQSSASNQISKNVDGINTVAQESASGTQQIALAAEGLNSLTENLQNLVSKFKLSQNEVSKKTSKKYEVAKDRPAISISRNIMQEKTDLV